MSKTTNKVSPEVRQRALRLVLDHEHEHPSRRAATGSIAARITNEIRRKASACFGNGEARPPGEGVIAFIDDHREVHGVEPICKVPRRLAERALRSFKRPPPMNLEVAMSIWLQTALRSGGRLSLDERHYLTRSAALGGAMSRVDAGGRLPRG